MGTQSGFSAGGAVDSVDGRVGTVVLDDLYQTLGDSQIFVTAPAFAGIGGSPTFAGIGGGRWAGLVFDAASQEIVAAAIEIPPSWTTLTVELYWTNGGAGSGNVVWALQLDRAGDGETLAASGGGGASGDLTIAAPAQDVLKVSTMVTDQACDQTKLLNLRLIRQAANVADTLGNDAAALGIRLRRTNP